MSGIVSYKSPQSYLNATEDFLLQRELENNLILGLCYGFPDRTQEYENCVFINLMRDNEIEATSIKTWKKAILYCTTKNEEHVKALASYYLQNNIRLAGVVGETFCAEQFAAAYGKRQGVKRTMLVHQLTAVNPQPQAEGTMVVAGKEDLELIIAWTENFERDAKSFPVKKREEIIRITKPRLENGDIFKWMVNGEPVSISAIVRKTKNFGIVGLVYTPDAHRGKGYATSCVQKLSEYILQSGYRYCGLFTDKANPTSNNIYKKIGYVATTEFSDIEFAS